MPSIPININLILDEQSAASFVDQISVANGVADEATSGHKVVGGVAIGLRVANQALAWRKVVDGLGCSSANGGCDDDQGGEGLSGVFHGVSVWVGCKRDCLHG